MSSRTAEEILCDKIELFSTFRLFAVVDDLQDLITKGLLKQVAGSVSIAEIKKLPALESIYMHFETIPGKTEYHLTYHGGGTFYKGSVEEYKKKYWEDFFSKRTTTRN